jgi:hypothetical protein
VSGFDGLWRSVGHESWWNGSILSIAVRVHGSVLEIEDLLKQIRLNGVRHEVMVHTRKRNRATDRETESAAASLDSHSCCHLESILRGTAHTTCVDVETDGKKDPGEDVDANRPGKIAVALAGGGAFEIDAVPAEIAGAAAKVVQVKPIVWVDVEWCYYYHRYHYHYQRVQLYPQLPLVCLRWRGDPLYRYEEGLVSGT